MPAAQQRRRNDRVNLGSVLLALLVTGVIVGVAWTSVQPRRVIADKRIAKPPIAPPDVVLINSKILTVDANDSIAEAIAIGDGKLIAVGSNADIAVWDRDMYTVPTNELKNLKCEMTLFNGQIVYKVSATPITVGIPAPGAVAAH